MTIPDRIGRWLEQPGNGEKAVYGFVAFICLCLYFTGEWSPLP